MTVVEVKITLGYPDGMETQAVQVALAQLADALEKDCVFEGVTLLRCVAEQVPA